MERLWHRLMIPASSIHCRDPLYLEAVEPFLITEYWNFLFSFLIFFDECHSKSYLFLDKGHFITVHRWQWQNESLADDAAFISQRILRWKIYFPRGKDR